MSDDIYDRMNRASGYEDSGDQTPNILARLDRNEELLRTVTRLLSQGNTFEDGRSMVQSWPDKDRGGKKTKREKKLAKKVKKLKKKNKQLAKQVELEHQKPEISWLQRSLSECAPKVFGIMLDEVALRQRAKYALPSKKESKNVIYVSPTDYKVV